ncbi:hypothetical protein NUU61_008356 [Penicillium alfredii]|uniref:Subtelomeric hrmA-associated cluster protein AFUB-079030/YDR124W-like helical bundle domain-containing protein n=1 Tax=Penicillium alfredii TaxID=1506179 RepID=A0A9W9ESF6_9EURO|nr:uncharacterized protein NUU61_008356 [Penicillium alfredii]KAJ5087049.1 hypothetical protein NUU61_008356 [Penicillium alfredii]
MSHRRNIELAYPHYALIYIDADGNLRHQSSQSIADSYQTIVSPSVTDAFLRAVARSRETHLSQYHVQPSAPMTPSPVTSAHSHLPSQIIPRPRSEMSLGREGPIHAPVSLGTPFQLTMRPMPQEATGAWHRDSSHSKKKKVWNEDLDTAAHQRVRLSLGDEELLRLYYEKAFENLQQTNCRVLAKAYVKLVEPRKQVNYPYNGRKIVSGRTRQLAPDATKPPWWPSGVSHREPDHLPKVERIRLLVHIVRELRTRYGVTVKRLKEADQPIRRQISPPERLQILDEVYQVREAEEKILEGATEGQQAVWISRANLPDKMTAMTSPEERSGNSTPTEPASVRNTDPHSSGDASATNTSQTLFAPVRDGSASSSPNNTQSIAPSLADYTEQNMHDLAGIESTQGVSVTPPDLKRKRECAATYSMDPINHISHTHDPSSTAIGIEPYGMGLYGDPNIFPSPAVTEPMGEYAFPYYFDY